jgi:hypothetical protein
VKFIGKAQEALAGVGFEYAEGFDLVEWQTVCDRMVALRDRFAVDNRVITSMPKCRSEKGLFEIWN